MRYFFIVVTICSLFAFSVNAQSVSNLKNQKARTEKEIAKLNELINEAAKTKSISLEHLNLYEKKISQTFALINTLNTELNVINKNIEKTEKKIADFTSQKNKLLFFYSRAIFEQWKSKDDENQFLYILASSSFDQAYRRYRYFKEMRTFTQNKVKEIEIINDSLKKLNLKNKALLQNKLNVKAEMDKQNVQLNSDKLQEQKLLSSIKSKEKSLRVKLNKEIANRKALDLKIKKLIEEEMKRSNSAKSNTIKLNETEVKLAANFESNRGKLPWPVEGGVITEKFGVHRHPVLTNVEINSSGISISAKKNSDVFSVFNGEVTNIVHVPGSNNIVFVRHGNYWTLYANLSEIYIKQGDKVTTGQKLGRIAYDLEQGSILKFEIWKNLEKLNPEIWLRR